MNNSYFISLEMDKANLELLSEDVLMAQVRLIAHRFDKKMQLARPGITVFTANELEKLSIRLRIYEGKFSKDKQDYIWAIRIEKLYESAVRNKECFAYPWMDKPSSNIAIEEFEKFIYSRRSIRCFTDEEIPLDNILKIIQYATWAPSTCNMQVLRYIVVRDSEIKNKISDGGLTGKIGQYIIAVVADHRFYDDWNVDGPIHDSAAAIQNMLIGCHYFGVGACYVSDQGVNLPKYRELLNVKEYEKITAFIWLGQYEKYPIIPERRDIRDVVEII